MNFSTLKKLTTTFSKFKILSKINFSNVNIIEVYIFIIQIIKCSTTFLIVPH